MARVEARIKTTLWDSDGGFVGRSAAAQRLYMLILSQSDLSMCGVAPLTVGRWASKAPDTTPADIRASLEELAEHRYVVVDEDNEEVWLRTFVLHDGVLKGPLTIIGMAKAWVAVHSPTIRDAVLESLPQWLIDGLLTKSEIPLPDTDRVLPDTLFGKLPADFVKGLLACARTRVQPPTSNLQPLPSAVLPLSSTASSESDSRAAADSPPTTTADLEAATKANTALAATLARKSQEALA